MHGFCARPRFYSACGLHVGHVLKSFPVGDAPRPSLALRERALHTNAAQPKCKPGCESGRYLMGPAAPGTPALAS